MANRQKDFIAEIKTQGLARTNRFTVELTPPLGNPADTRKALLFCEKASLPGVSYATSQNRTFGEVRETPYDKLYDTCQLTFHVDRHMTVKKLFDDWMHHIQDPIDRSFQWYANYITDLTIRVQDLEDRTTYEVTLYEAYPKSLGAVSLNAADNNESMRLDVTFQYKYWSSNLIEQAPNDELRTADGLNKYISDFSGFQEKYLKGLGEAGNFLTGAVGQIAQRSFSSVVSRIPSIKF